MKIIRYQTPTGEIEFGTQAANGCFRLRGDIYNSPQPTSEPAQVAKLLTPITPTSILCIGLNYRKHAEETNAKVPQHPVLFVKGINAVQNPNDPIEIPTFLKSEQVDYECELAVVIGKRCKNVRRADAAMTLAPATGRKPTAAANGAVENSSIPSRPWGLAW